LRRSKYSDWTIRNRVPIKTLFSDENTYLNRIIAIAGWIRTSRDKKKFSFVVVYDGSTYNELQVIVDSQCPGYEHILDHTASISASVLIIGLIVRSKGSGQKLEMQAHEFRLLGPSTGDFPLAKKQHTLEFLRTIGHFRQRSYLISSVTRIRNSLAFATHLFFQQRGFYYINTPIITASDCEGAGDMFQVTTILHENIKDVPVTQDGKVDYSKDFFTRPAFLTVSGQLNAEIYACAMGSVYTFGPTFRAENSNTTRHLAEFWMIEPEIAFADLNENMNVAEAFVKFTINYVLEHNEFDLQFLEEFEQTNLKEKIDESKKRAKETGEKVDLEIVKGFRGTPLRERLTLVANSDFGRVTYTEAVEILKTSGVKFDEDVYWGIDLGSEHERWLAEKYYKKPVIVTNYPKEFKAFYMRLDEDGRTVSAMDVLVPGVGELIGGSQREERLDVLLERLKEKGLEEEMYGWYLDLRRYGSVVHSGFGLGFERLVCYVTGLENIRESIPFPRYPGHSEY